MAFTRFHDDPYRLQRQAAESSFMGRYFLDVPGQGDQLPFHTDPQLRLQGWGANVRTNAIHIESDLRGLTRPLNRDHVDANNYKRHQAASAQVSFGSEKPFVEESRASHPAWMYKDLECSRWESPLLNPQHGLEKTFADNIQTRILEKDAWVTAQGQRYQ